MSQKNIPLVRMFSLQIKENEMRAINDSNIISKTDVR